MMAITITGLLFIIGVVHDVGGQIRTTFYAAQVAAEAARAGGQAVDTDIVAAHGDHSADRSAAERAALAYLSDADADGWVAFSEDSTEITVGVNLTYRRVILGLFGFNDYEVTRQATARLVAG
jgi:hypothetical protein